MRSLGTVNASKPRAPIDIWTAALVLISIVLVAGLLFVPAEWRSVFVLPVIPTVGWIIVRQTHKQYVNADERRPSAEAASSPGNNSAVLAMLGTAPGNTASALTRHSTDLVAVVGIDGRVRQLSDNLAQHLGTTAGPGTALLDRPFSELLHPDDRARWLGCLAEFSGGSRTHANLDRLCMLRRHAEPAYLDVYVSNECATPSIDGLVLNARDVTDRIAVERALACNESKFTSVFHASEDAIVIVRATDWMVQDFNPAFTRLLGLCRQDAIGVQLDALGLWPAKAPAVEFLQRARTSATGVEERVALRHCETGELLEAGIAARLTEIDGALALLLVVRDYTETEQTRHALLEVERKFTLVFNAAPDGIVIIRDADRVVIDINDYLCELTGFAKENVLGQKLDFSRAFADRGAAQHATDMLERLGGYRNLTLDLRVQNGPDIPVLVSATSFQLDGERCSLNLVRDVRDLRRAEQALRRADARFRAAFEDAPMGIALVDPELNIIDANHWLASMLGLARSALVGLDFAQVVPEDERAGLRHFMLQRLTQHNGTSQREQSLLRPNGELRSATVHVVVQDEEDNQAPYLIVQLVDVTDIKRSQEQMERLAYYDPLTGLANRRLFMDRLEQALQRSLRSGKPSAVLFLDLDQFKKINDTHGHDAGDMLLKVVADRLRNSVRREDTVARLGGDEFNVLLHEVRDVDAAGQVAENLLQALCKPVTTENITLSVTTSIGIAMLPSDGTDAAALVQRADHAMYQAKQQGRNTFRFYADSLSARFTERMGYAQALEQALARDELTLFYQPILSLDGTALHSVEALLRWQHPQRGLLAPSAFLDASEHAGLMRELDLWAVRHALTQLAAFDAAGYDIPAIALNISGRHIGDAEFVRVLGHAADAAQIATSRVALELPERLLVRDLDLAEQWLQSLRSLGFEIGIDDFGAAASSINAITQLPVQRVKLDNSVVQRLATSSTAAVLTETVIELCRRVGREVIAEGLETEAQQARLARAGCAFAQGYLLAAPQTAIELLQWLAVRRPTATRLQA